MLTTLDKVKEEFRDRTVGGECSNCGQCCSNILPVGAHEVERIRKFVKKHNIQEQIKRYPTQKVVHDFVCPFRSEQDKECLIYPVRPAICRDFRCDKPHKNIMADKEMYHGKFDVVDMRATFYGKDPVVQDLLMKIMGE